MKQNNDREGAALIVALWVSLILSVLVASFAFDMHVEAKITSSYRKRIKAQHLARSGVAYAKLLMARSKDVDEEAEAEDGEDEQLLEQSIRLSRGAGIQNMKQELGDGSFSLSIFPEQARRNVNKLSDEDWEELLDQAFVPEELWPDLIDCFTDWTDENENHELNGAESDDEFYEERGYETKNAPLETIDELLMIKGFTREIVYGSNPQALEEDEQPMVGIARWLTVFGDGKINVNTASREVLMTIPDIDEAMVDDIIEGRIGFDQEGNTRDDGFESMDELSELGLSEEVTATLTTESQSFYRVISIGEVSGIKTGIWCIMLEDDDEMRPIFWREENMK